MIKEAISFHIPILGTSIGWFMVSLVLSFLFSKKSFKRGIIIFIILIIIPYLFFNLASKFHLLYK